MTPAQFKTIREANRLSIADIASICISTKTKKPVKEKTVRNWERGIYDIPLDVIDTIYDLEIKRVQESTLLFENIMNDNPEKEVILRRYKTNTEMWEAEPKYKGLPVSYHGAILYKTMDLLESQDLRVTIIWA